MFLYICMCKVMLCCGEETSHLVISPVLATVAVFAFWFLVQIIWIHVFCIFFTQLSMSYFGLILLFSPAVSTMMAIFAFLQELSENCNWQFLGYFYKSFVLCGSETLVIILSLKNILVILHHNISSLIPIQYLFWDDDECLSCFQYSNLSW